VNLSNYRQVRVTIACDSTAGNIVYETWTTRTEEQITAYAMSASTGGRRTVLPTCRPSKCCRRCLVPTEPETPLQVAVKIYCKYRRRGMPPTEALQQLAVDLATVVVMCEEDGEVWPALEAGHWITLAAQHINLLAIRVGIDTARERFWATGRLSQPTDRLLFLTNINGNRYWHRTCHNLACAIKHGMAAFEFPEWVAFSIERPDGDVVLEPVGPGITLEAVYQLTDGD
jgi:hypothetical protein